VIVAVVIVVTVRVTKSPEAVAPLMLLLGCNRSGIDTTATARLVPPLSWPMSTRRHHG